MNKVLCSLLLIAVIGTAQCETFKRIHFDQGRVPVERNLETVAAPTRAALEGTNVNHTTVSVKILPEFLTNNTKEATAKTGMSIFLHAAESGFCDSYYSNADCDRFVRLNCNTDKECKTSSYSFGIHNAKERISSAYYITTEYPSFISLENSTAWKLSTRPVIFHSISVSGNEPLAKESSYGFIGLGTEGLARANFADADKAVFSLTVNSTGKGSLILGNDTTLIPSGRKDKPLAWNTTANWIGSFVNMTSKHINVTTKDYNYPVKVFFSLNQEKSTIPSAFYGKLVSGFNLTMYNSTPVYNSSMFGPISKHSPVTMVIGENNVTVPVEAFFRKIEGDANAKNLYTFMADSLGDINNVNTTTTNWEYYMIFGNHFLSNFYTVFSAQKDKTPCVTLYPTFTAFVDSGSSSSSGSGLWYTIIGVIAFVLVFIAALVQKGKAKGSENSLDSSLNKPSIGLELR